MDKQYTSNLLNDIELAKRFNEEAFLVARSLRSKYYSVFDYMTEDDIVMECWDKILRQDISFDASKKCKFESFVRMMVNNRCIDMSRKIRKYEQVSSLDSTYSTDDGDSSTLSDYIPDVRSSDDFNMMEFESIIESFDSEIYSIPIEEIISKLSHGYSIKEISEELDIKSSDIRKLVKGASDVFKKRYNGSTETLADILYGDEDELMLKKDNLVFTLSYIQDSNGIKLSDIVKLVIKGYSYDRIGNKFGVSGGCIKSFLDKCSSMVV